MECLIGGGLAVVVCLFATLAGLDRDRVFYPTLATVITSYYILFAVIGKFHAGAFPALAVAGFEKLMRRSGFISKVIELRQQALPLLGRHARS